MHVIQADSLSFIVPSRGKDKILIDDISLNLQQGSFTAIIGPSGCGKSTLLKLLAGFLDPTDGEIRIGGYDVKQLRKDLPLTIGFLPQFACFHEGLSVREILENASKLRLPLSVSVSQRKAWLQKVIELTSISPVLGQSPETLSGGQLRRLALAEQLIGDPPFLFLDELTSGLDPNSEREIMVWLADLVKQTGRTILLVTHSVSNLTVCDNLIFLSKGKLIYNGNPGNILRHFGAADMEHIYAASENYPKVEAKKIEFGEPKQLRTAKPPMGFVQLGTLLKRQALLFSRDRGQIILQLMMLVTFPFLVAIFAYRGLPEVRSISMELKTNVVRSLAEQLFYLRQSFDLASLVSGLSMFQVILLALTGANNGAREISRERGILTKELSAGLSPLSYLVSKFLFIGVLSAAQSLWMTIFVRTVCDFPGSFEAQFLILFLTTFGMSSTCLWFSAFSTTPEKSSLLAIYWVGLQLPLSGAVLALPDVMTFLTKPLISAYWGWAGYLRTFETYRHFDVVSQSTKTAIASYQASVTVLLAHVICAFAFTWWVVKRIRN
jgi:ABC transport system ATP-binding/permease protein